MVLRQGQAGSGPRATGSSGLVPMECCREADVGPVLLNLPDFSRRARNLNLVCGISLNKQTKKSHFKNVAITIFKTL